MVFVRPRTRLEEIARARGISQKELAERGGWHVSNLNRLFLGTTGISESNRQRLAVELQCPESALIEPIGRPIPPPGARAGMIPGSTVPGFDLRLKALLLRLHIDHVEDLLLYLIGGDFSGLPDKLARRLRESLRDLGAAVSRNETDDPPDDPPDHLQSRPLGGNGTDRDVIQSPPE